MIGCREEYGTRKLVSEVTAPKVLVGTDRLPHRHDVAVVAAGHEAAVGVHPDRHPPARADQRLPRLHAAALGPLAVQV